MTNAEKYKTAQERVEGFNRYCMSFKECQGCKIQCGGAYDPKRYYVWLELEAEEEMPLLCPFCRKKLDVSRAANTKSYGIHCDCGYYAPWKKTKHEVIAAHNRVARKCMEVEE